MSEEEIKEYVYDFYTTHTAIVSHEIKERDEYVRVGFTNYGTKAACRAIFEIIDLLDSENKDKVISYINSKKVNNGIYKINFNGL